MCGIVGAISLDGEDHDIGALVIDLLRFNINRGQDGYGISILLEDGSLTTFKFNKLGTDIRDKIKSVPKKIIGMIGHARYTTSGGNVDGTDYVQPFSLNHLKYGMAFAFNGNITNALELAEEIEQRDSVTFDRPILDTAVLKYMILSYVKEGNTDIKYILQKLNKKIDGACNIVLLSKDGSMGFSKDRWGFRPLSWESQDGVLSFSSESGALFKIGGDDQPKFLSEGAMVIAKAGSEDIYEGIMDLELKKSSCFFEVVYFANSKTKLNGKAANLHRYSLGWTLAKDEILENSGTIVFDRTNTIVSDVPSSSAYSADGYADGLDLQYVTGLITKNPDIGRTFIAAGEVRDEIIRKKYIFNPSLKTFVKGRKVVLIDDSVVRGSTMNKLISDFRDFYEPSEIHIRIPSPPICSPCFYGINMATIKELITRKHFKDVKSPTEEELQNLAGEFGSQSIKYLSKKSLTKAIKMDERDLCLACIDSNYPTTFGKKRFEEQMDTFKADLAKNHKD